jgi:tRNA 2-selenouridine synthase
MAETLDIKEFLHRPGPIVDVRSPGEYTHAHIPEALSLPLFSDEERAQVGTTYKQIGSKPALIQGLACVGPKLASFAASASTLGLNARLYCFRGGMRSQSMSWLFELTGMKVFTLKGGYKAFRRFVLQKFSLPYRFNVIGGLTGCGKTEKLNELRKKGEQVLDLEALAGHRGSAFGLLGMQPQSSNEHFENKLAIALHQMNPDLPIWVEDESRMIGACKIPDALFHQLSTSPFYLLECSLEERLKRLLTDYGSFPVEQLETAVQRISKRLGGARTREIVKLLHEQNLAEACLLLLKYYDSAYLHSTRQGAAWIPFSHS